MEHWYESSCPSESDAEKIMQKSHIYICLNKETNTPSENEFLCQIATNSFSKERERLNPSDNTIASKAYTFKKITFDSIRQNPKWKELSNTILIEEIVAHKPYGSWRGFVTFVTANLREKFIIRIIREIWAPYIINNTLAPIWLEYNYSPEKGGKGYFRTKNHYNSLLKKNF
jgi:hypothetical protein